MTLDVAFARHSHDVAGQTRILVHEIGMHEAWTPGDFTHAVVEFYLPRIGTERGFDRSLVVQKNIDDTFAGRMYGSNGLRGYANVFQVDDRTLRIEFHKRLLAAKPLPRYSYKAYVSSSFECPPDVVCAPPPPDKVPNRGRIVHDL